VKCGDKEWQHCQVEKRGCPGCYYDEIKIGEYVRTRNNGIKRIDTIFENKTVNKYGYETGSDWDGKWYSHIKTTEIVKHSNNLIDLIEIGDILKVYLPIRQKTIIVKVDEYFEDSMILKGIQNKNVFLKAIVTHEQIENIEYKIQEKR